MGGKGSKSARQDTDQVSGKPVEETEHVDQNNTAKKLTVLHFNDIYNIEPAERDPVGGAARLAYKVKEFKKQQANPLVLFSGDAFNPSLLSTMTLGKQMVPVLNGIGVVAACCGNHDFDYGTDNFVKLSQECKFPWLMANVLDKNTGEPYAQAKASLLLDWHGIKVGIVGLVEEDWLETLGQVNLDDLQYTDFVACGRELANKLKADGAEVLIALTHMREPNDRKLAAEAPEFDLILGGHDHHYVAEVISPHQNLLVKSGTEFRDLTEVEVVLSAEGRPKMKWTDHSIVSALPEDPEVKAVVDEYMEMMGSRLDEVIAETITDLDGRFQTVRKQESNLGNFVTDVWRRAVGADICLMNSGSLRSDTIHPAGPLKVRDFVSVLPMLDATVVLECSGSQVIQALENGVSQYPKLEGRFLQVSGISFKFDPDQPEGQRIVADSVCVNGKPLEPATLYTVATKEYLADGKDGFDVFLECKTLQDAEVGPVIPTTIKNHFRKLDVLNLLDPKVTTAALANKWMAKSIRSAPQADGDRDSTSEQRDNDGTAIHHPETGKYCIGPEVQGRIINIKRQEDQ